MLRQDLSAALELPETFSWTVDGEEHVLTPPPGARVGDECQFSFKTERGETRTFMARIPTRARAAKYRQPRHRRPPTRGWGLEICGGVLLLFAWVTVLYAHTIDYVIYDACETFGAGRLKPSARARACAPPLMLVASCRASNPAGFALATCEEIHRHITKSEAMQLLFTLVICLAGSIWYRLDNEEW